MADGVCYVYWIHLPEHADVFTQGYVGFTTRTPEIRWAQHISDHNKPKRAASKKLYNSMLKYGVDSFKMDVLCVCTEEYGLWLENKLRPTPQIGLNILCGGTASRSGQKVSEEEIAKRVVGLKKFSKENPLWWNPVSDRVGWANADLLYKAYLNGVGRKRVSTSVSEGDSKELFKTVWKKIQTGWVPTEDADWQKFRREYPHLIDVDAFNRAVTAGSATDNFKRVSIQRRSSRPYSFNPDRLGKASREFLLKLEEAHYLLDGGFTPLTSAEIFEKYNWMPKTSIVNWLARFRGGWNPSEDQEYLTWREAYLEEQRKEPNDT